MAIAAAVAGGVAAHSNVEIAVGTAEMGLMNEARVAAASTRLTSSRMIAAIRIKIVPFLFM